MGYKYNEQILRMIKNGHSKEQIQNYLLENQKEYAPDFVAFIDEMLKKHKIKRTDISDATGISKDYLYKVLNGTKITNERDYLIAIAIAIGMSLNETQHLLSISNMHAIDRNDLRDLIIWDSLEDHISLFHVNERLEKVNLPYIKTSKDMETYIPDYNSLYNENSYTSEWGGKKSRRKFTELDREIVSEHVGLAPFDYDYCATITVVDEENNKYYVQGYYSHLGNQSFSIIDEKNYDLFLKSKENPELIEQMELIGDYANFEDTYDSEFFHFFLEIDRATTIEVEELLDSLDDTKNFRFRVGVNMPGNEWVKYCELYDETRPANKQYLQIVEVGNKTTFSASHESVYMRLELGELYEFYYGKYEDPLYYIKSSSIEDIPNLDLVTKFAFQGALVQMHEALKEMEGNFVTKSEVELLEEKAEFFAINAAAASHMENYEECIEANEASLSCLTELNDEYSINKTSEIVLTLWKLKYCYERLGDGSTAEKFSNYILEYKDDCLENPDLLSGFSADCIAGLILKNAQNLQRSGNNKAALVLTKEAILLLEGKDDSEEACKTLFTAYNKAAYICDEADEIEEAEDFYQKANILLKKYKLERSDNFKNNILTFYNNYAWLLWNKIDSEEAIIYYGREIELIEDYLISDSQDRKTLLGMLETCSNALLDIYEYTDKEFEAKRLKKRVKNIKKL